MGSNPTTCIKFKIIKSANSNSKIIELIKQIDIPYSPGVRIVDFHSTDPGSSPGMGKGL